MSYGPTKMAHAPEPMTFRCSNWVDSRYIKRVSLPKTLSKGMDFVGGGLADRSELYDLVGLHKRSGSGRIPLLLVLVNRYRL